VIVKKITMDRMGESEAREVIRWEAEQHVPFDMDNVELDFQILDPEGTGLQMTVLLVAAKRELVDHKVALLADVGLQSTIIDVDAFALHNAFEINYPEAMNGVVGLVNIGHEVTNIYILDDGIPVLTRDIPVGTRRFREDLQRERGQSAEEAERMLQGGSGAEIPEAFLQTRAEEVAVLRALPWGSPWARARELRVLAAAHSLPDRDARRSVRWLRRSVLLSASSPRSARSPPSSTRTGTCAASSRARSWRARPRCRTAAQTSARRPRDRDRPCGSCRGRGSCARSSRSRRAR